MYCTSCGTKNDDNARYCRSCGRPISSPASNPNSPVAPAVATARDGASHQRTAAMVLGLIAATFLLITGCTAFVTGSAFEAFDEAGFIENDGAEGSTPEEISQAGSLAVIVAIVLFVGAGLAKAAWTPSFWLLLVALGGLVWTASIDTWSVFAAVYYLGIALVGVCVGLMWKAREPIQPATPPSQPVPPTQRTVSGTWQCLGCGRNNPVMSSFCTACRQARPTPSTLQSVGSWQCLGCGRNNPPAASRCIGCRQRR